MAGRDKKGRFVKGNEFGKHKKKSGRPKDAVRLKLNAIIDENVPPEAVAAAWKRLASVLETGGKGWLEYFEFYMNRRYGRPPQYVSADITSGGKRIKGYTILAHPDMWPANDNGAS